MKKPFCIGILLFLTFQSRGYGQGITLQAPHPITYTELASPLVPLVSKNGRKEYFIRHVYSQQARYGGRISRKWLTLGPELLAFYENSPLVHLNLQKQRPIVGTDTAAQITYYTSQKPWNSQFDGLFSSKSYDPSRIRKIDIPGFNAGDIHSFYMNATWDILLFSTQHSQGIGQEDLYVSLANNGEWAPPIHLGATINTEGAEISPFLSNDRKNLFFSSNGHGGYGQGDIFVAERLYDSWQVWSQPVNLGKEINSAGYEAYLSIMEDSVAYFFSETDAGRLWVAHVEPNTPPNLFRRSATVRDYLEEEEVDSWLGVTIDTTLSFVADDLLLTRNSQEVLWFIANQMINTSGVCINLTYIPHPDANQAKARSIVVRKYLTQLGIEENRIFSHVLANQVRPPNARGDVVFNFFRPR